MSKKKSCTAYDRLIGSYYGGGSLELNPTRRVKDLLTGYYGNGPSAPRAAQPVSMSLGCDDGEMLPQRLRPSRGERPYTGYNPYGAYGMSVQQSDDVEFVEYVVEGGVPAPPRTTQPPPVAPSRRPEEPRSEQPPMLPTRDAETPTRPTNGGAQQPADSGSPASDDDFMGDLKAIMRGEKTYDKDKGKIVERSSGNGGGNGGAKSETAAPPPPISKTANIFDRIAQSMQYANAYDLGSVELENRFAEFDRAEDQRKKAEAAKKKAKADAAARRDAAANAPETTEPVTRPDTTDFISDLGAMRSSPRGNATGDTATSLSLELVRRREFSRPFYDTGEHVLVSDAYAGTFHVGKSPGVEFSYGQLVAMGDLYDNVDKMMNASVAELTRIKALIAQDTAYYEGKKQNKALGVSNDVWAKTLPDSFLRLAEDNYEHFSPSHVAMGAALITPHSDNQAQWQKHHQQAIEEAQKMLLASNGRVSLFYEYPLIINAFGDHFLTDAFAAGHLINKDVLYDRFEAAFYKTYSLTSAGEDFFKRVAKKAWRGDVAAKFSDLETAEGVVHIPVIGNVGHPNIDDADRFGDFLIQAANQEPRRISNLIAKALHDHLNEHGVEVTNQAGDGTWYLPGDGTLMVGTGRLTAANLTKNFNIIRKAVQQSIDDVNNAPTVSITDFSDIFAGVWKYAPVLTSAGQKEVTALIKDFTDPKSSTLVDAAVKIIESQLDTIIDLVVNKLHKLRPR